jgi:hypothetical protein
MPIQARALAAAALLSLAALAALFAFAPGVARAGLSWCAGDPILDIEGNVVSVVVYVPPDELGNIDGDVEVTITVPTDTDVEVLLIDETYFTQDVTIVRRGNSDDEIVPVQVDARVKSTGAAFEVAMSVAWPGEDDTMQEQWVFARANSWMKSSFEVDREHEDEDR